MARHKPPPSAALTPVGDTGLFRPSSERPVRVRARALPADNRDTIS